MKYRHIRPLLIGFLLISTLITKTSLASYDPDSKASDMKTVQVLSSILTHVSLGEPIPTEILEQVSSQDRAHIELFVNRVNDLTKHGDAYRKLFSEIELTPKMLHFQPETLIKRIERAEKQLALSEKAVKKYYIELPEELKAVKEQSELSKGLIQGLEENSIMKVYMAEYFKIEKQLLKTEKSIALFCKNTNTRYNAASNQIIFDNHEELTKFLNLVDRYDSLISLENKILNKMNTKVSHTIEKLDSFSELDD